MFTNEKNIMQISWLQTQIKIVKFELRKKKESRKRERWPVVLSVNDFT